MKLFSWCVIGVVMVGVMGCTPPKKQKEEAYKQWNAARASAQGNLANEQYRNGNLADARRTVDEAIKLAPDNVTYRLLSARIYIEGNTLEAAQRELDEARKVDAKSAEAEFLSGVVYQRWQKPNLALDYYTRATEKAPAELAYIMARAETMVQIGQVGEAVALLESKLAYFEHSGAVRDLLGILYAQQGRHKEAEESLRQAVILSPEQPEFREHLARTLFRAQKYRDAISELTTVLKHQSFSRRADMHLLLGECHMMINQPREARVSFDTATSLSPNLAAAWLGLSKAAMELGDKDRAEIAIQKAVALEPDDAQTQLALGFLRFRQDRFPEARAALTKASELDATDAVSLCLLGMISEKEGKRDEAMQFYAKALKAKPDDDLAKSLMSRQR